MITNNDITYYHKTLDENKLPIWNRYILEDVWAFGGKGSSINRGYENANDINVRIPFTDLLAGLPIKGTKTKQVDAMQLRILNNIEVKKLSKEQVETIRNIFSIGDIIALGHQDNIEKQSDLKGIEFYNVTSVNINNFGNNPHIHLGGK